MATQVGSLDRLTAIVGERGVGKSTFMMDDADAFRREVRGGYVVGHSPGARLPEIMPDGRKTGVEWADTIKQLEKHLSSRPGNTHILVAGDPEDVIDYARSLSLALRRKAVEKAGYMFKRNRPIPSDVGPVEPILVMIDEGTAIREAPKGSDELRQWQIFLTGLRHEHIALTWAIQSPTARNWILIEQANRLVTYRYGHEWGLNVIRARGVPAEDLDAIRALPKYQSRTYVFGA